MFKKPKKRKSKTPEKLKKICSVMFSDPNRRINMTTKMFSCFYGHPYFKVYLVC